LALYRHDLAAEHVMRNYHSWTSVGRPSEIVSGEPDSLYLFDDTSGNSVRNHGVSAVSLSIPERYRIAQPTLLAVPGSGYEGKWSDAQDILVNIGGFIPFGFTLSGLLSQLRRVRKSLLLTVLAGLTVSLIIEGLQYYLPTRNSDMSDVITNTLGAWIGVMLFGACRTPGAHSVDA
jgi:VanZ family protein